MRTIDMTPTWAGLMPALLAILENGTEEGRDTAQAELMRAARALDEANAHAKADAEEPEGHTVDQVLTTSPGRAGAATYVLFKDYGGNGAAYWLDGEHAAAHVLRTGQKLTEAEARARFDFANEYRR